jgi:hypothetical protein
MATLCNKCGLFISRRKATKALSRHEWRDHREDAPRNLRIFSEFWKWSNTAEGMKWVKNQQADRVVELSEEDACLFLGETPPVD